MWFMCSLEETFLQFEVKNKCTCLRDVNWDGSHIQKLRDFVCDFKKDIVSILWLAAFEK